MLRARGIMTTEVVAVAEDHSLDEVYEKMRQHQVRHLPVCRNGFLIGLISEGDILLHSTEINGVITVPALSVREAMVNDVVTCYPSSSIADVAATMITCKIDCIPVTADGQLLGIITSTDLMDLVCQSEEINGGKVMPLDFCIRGHQRNLEARELS